MGQRAATSDWLEAFSHHPRIGDRERARPSEPKNVGSPQCIRHDRFDELRRTNRAYEEKFGHIYIVCATGKSAEEMLAIARLECKLIPGRRYA